MQTDIYKKHEKLTKEKTKSVEKLADAEKLFAEGFKGFVELPLVETDGDNFEKLSEKYKISRRCILLNKSNRVIIAKSY